MKIKIIGLLVGSSTGSLNLHASSEEEVKLQLKLWMPEHPPEHDIDIDNRYGNFYTIKVVLAAERGIKSIGTIFVQNSILLDAEEAAAWIRQNFDVNVTVRS